MAAIRVLALAEATLNVPKTTALLPLLVVLALRPTDNTFLTVLPYFSAKDVLVALATPESFLAIPSPDVKPLPATTTTTITILLLLLIRDRSLSASLSPLSSLFSY